MPQYEVSTRLQQIQLAIANRETHRSTCLLMDFIRDFTLKQEDLYEAVSIRKFYNNSRSLGDSDVSDEEQSKVLEKASVLLQKISVICIKSGLGKYTNGRANIEAST